MNAASLEVREDVVGESGSKRLSILRPPIAEPVGRSMEPGLLDLQPKVTLPGRPGSRRSGTGRRIRQESIRIESEASDGRSRSASNAMAASTSRSVENQTLRRVAGCVPSPAQPRITMPALEAPWTPRSSMVDPTPRPASRISSGTRPWPSRTNPLSLKPSSPETSRSDRPCARSRGARHQTGPSRPFASSAWIVRSRGAPSTSEISIASVISRPRTTIRSPALAARMASRRVGKVRSPADAEESEKVASAA